MDLVRLPVEELVVRDILRDQVQVSADRPFIRCGPDVATYGEIYAAALRERMELDRIGVTPSPVGRPGSDSSFARR